MLEFLKIVLLGVLAAVVYGVLHDQVTARVCVEYFTVGHPRVIASESPTLLALVWGTLATWWFGLILGLPAAGLARVGGLPKLTARDLVKPVAVVMAVTGIVALVAGVTGYLLAEVGVIRLSDPFVHFVPAQKHSAFLANGWAHLAAYGTGGVGALVVWGWVLRRRYRVWRRGVEKGRPDREGRDAHVAVR